MGIGYNSKIVTRGLKFCIDSGNIKSYSGSGSTQYDLITGGSSVNGSYVGSSSFGSSFNNMSGFTGICVIDILGSDAGYAYHPVNKWNTGTTDASFVLYHFQQGSGSTNDLIWYANAGGTWTGLGLGYNSGVGRYITSVQYGSSKGGQHWINGLPIGSRSSALGLLGTGSSDVIIDGHVSGRAGIHKVLFTALYNIELSDEELSQNHSILKARFGV